MKLTELLENYKPIPKQYKPVPTPKFEGTRASIDKESEDWPLSRCHIMTNEYIMSISQGGPLDNDKTIALILDAASRDPFYVMCGLHALAIQHMGPTFKTTVPWNEVATTEGKDRRKVYLRKRLLIEGEDAGFIYNTDFVLDKLSNEAVETVKKMCRKIISTTPLGGNSC